MKERLVHTQDNVSFITAAQESDINAINDGYSPDVPYENDTVISILREIFEMSDGIYEAMEEDSNDTVDREINDYQLWLNDYAWDLRSKASRLAVLLGLPALHHSKTAP